MRMAAEVFEKESEYDVVLGPCPGCESWQLDYTWIAAGSFWDVSTFHDVVEDLLQEHLAECPHLQLLLDHGL